MIMKLKLYFSRISLIILLLVSGGNAFAQVTVVSSDSLSCTVPCTTLTATVVGDAPTPSGIAIDDIYSPVLPIGFSFNYYGTTYTQLVIGPNGTLCFDLTLAGAFDPWPITAVLLGNPSKYNNICGPWCDIDISIPGGGTITYSLTGVAPFRKYIVTFCNDHMYSCTTQITSTQIILYETTNNIECHIATKPICAGWNSGRAIIGVQNATGTAATVAPARDFPLAYTCTNEAWRFTPDATVSSYAVSAIPYAPIPYASSAVHWYNATTGAYLGTGFTQTVCPTTTTTYKAGALGCADTSFGYYTVTPAPTFTISLTSSNPTLCGACDGSITISGFTPGMADTINYQLGGVPQPTIYATASAAGTVTLTGLCAGTYSNFIAHQGICATPPAGPVTLTNPPISMTAVPTSPSLCGNCDGAITLSGLYASHIFNVTYDFNGVAQPPVGTTTNSAGEIILTGLCEGVYTNIVAAFGPCATPPIGPISLLGPPPPPGVIVSTVDPTECGYCNGTIVLRAVAPFSSDTVSYSINGVAQPPIITVALSDSTIILPGLCAGTYSGFSVKIGHCTKMIFDVVTLTAPPLVSLFDTSVSLGCKGDTVFFNNMSTSSGPLAYVWNFGDGASDTAKNPFHVYPAGTYTVSLLATNGFCDSITTLSMTLGHPLAATYTMTPTILCQHDSVTFTNTSTGATHYLWMYGTGVKDTTSNPVYTYHRTGKYAVALIAANDIPCYDTIYKPVEVDTISGMNIKLTDTVMCAGVYITMTGLFASIGNTGITWAFGDGDSIKNVNPVYHAYTKAGEYTINSNAYYRACPTATNNRKVTVIQQPTIDLGRDTSICKGSESILLSDKYNAGNPQASWVWSSGQSGSSMYVTAPGVYFATINISNCRASDTVKVTDGCYIEVPNVFTPNGDGINDYFFPRQLLARGLTEFKMFIYNRWGQVIFESKTLDGSGWDGRLNGVEQPVGVYVFSIDAAFKDGEREHHQGNVTLLR